jgi:hypothetical protein
MSSSNLLIKTIILTLLSAFFLGPYLLESIGIQYVSQGGGPLFKIHIYSYFILLMVGLSFFTGKGIQYINALAELKPYWLICLACISFVLIYGLLRQGMSGMAYVVDTLLTPLLIIPLLLMLNTQQKALIIKLLAWLLLLNSLVAILEFSQGSSFIFVDFSSFSHFRSSAFLAHPLNNALITATLAPLLMNKTRVPAVLYFFIVLLSLFAFGGRGAMGIFIIASLVISLPAINTFMTTGVKTSAKKFAFYQLGFFCAALGLVYALLFTPIGDRIISKMHVDNSAQTRFDVFIILESLSIQEWFFGASNQFKENIIYFIGQKTIENYVIGWIVSFGLLGAIPLLISVFCLPIKMVMSMPLNAKMAVMTLFLVSITNNALTVKTTALLLVFITLVSLYRQGVKSDDFR